MGHHKFQMLKPVISWHQFFSLDPTYYMHQEHLFLMFELGLFDKKLGICTVCNKETKRKHKPKKEWNLKGWLCEPCFNDKEKYHDELKNQWGWGGYTTHDLERCNLSARAVALVYNWWSWYVRLAHPQARREAITSRPLLLSGVARMTEHAGQKRLLITLTHAAGDQIQAMLAAIRAGLDHVRATAPQLANRERWRALVQYIIDQILTAKAAQAPPSRCPGTFQYATQCG